MKKIKRFHFIVLFLFRIGDEDEEEEKGKFLLHMTKHCVLASFEISFELFRLKFFALLIDF
jgi:hypothetical protein